MIERLMTGAEYTDWGLANYQDQNQNSDNSGYLNYAHLCCSLCRKYFLLENIGGFYYLPLFTRQVNDRLQMSFIMNVTPTESYFPFPLFLWCLVVSIYLTVRICV